MRHKKTRHRLNRFTSWRRATLISLAKNLLKHQSIRTTQVKALAVRPLIDKLITLTKQNSLSARRQAYRILGEHQLVSLLFNDFGRRFSGKTSGFTRILKLGLRRRGDNAKLVKLEFTQIKEKPAKPKEEKEVKPEKELRPERERRPPTPLPVEKKPAKKFLGGLRKIFKKERDAL